ncbi:MAG: zinc-binding dehydrogenase [Myxococcota bacterium]
MTAPEEGTGFQLRSTVFENGTLQLSLESVPIPEPKDDEVLVRIEASPINPSDLGVLFGVADMTTVTASGTEEQPIITASIPDKLMGAMKGRIGTSLPVGNEGAGVVIAAGSSPAAQALIGKTVGMIGGGMYSQYRAVPANRALPLEEGTTPAEGASCFVNPLTALGMVETMRLEGHEALVHTAAASNLGQMLQKVCLADGIPLVNIVRKSEQAELLREIGATYVCNSSEPSFTKDLVEAISAAGATLAFDAVGGGRLASQILSAMEAAAATDPNAPYTPYGTSVHKQVYIYGFLDRGPTEIVRNFGLTWGVGGWLLTPFLQRIGLQRMIELQTRVAREIKTTFASSYTREVSLNEALTLEAIGVYGRQATGTKFLINPNKS